MDVNDLVLESRYPEYNFCIKGPRETNWKDGFPVQQPKHIVLTFDRFLCELNDMAREQEWTEEDKEYVGHALDNFLNNPQFTDMWLHVKPTVPKPWPSYDSTHHNQVAVIAQATGTVGEALNYERNSRPGGPRESVILKLEAALDSAVQVEDDDLAAV